MTENKTTTQEKPSNDLLSTFDFPLVDFSGKEIPNANVKELILQATGGAKAKDGADSIKKYDLGIKVANDQELKSEDIVLLRSIISENESFTVLAKGQILKLIENK